MNAEPQVDIQQLVPGLFRVRIPTTMAHLLNTYLWLGPDGVTVFDTGWPGSAHVLESALRQLDRGTGDIERIVLSHFHDDHVGSAADVAAWSASTVVAGRADAPYIRGSQPGPEPKLTEAEQALKPPLPIDTTPPPPCRVDYEADDGDILDFAGGALVLHVPGHTAGGIALHLSHHGVLLTGDLVAEFNGQVITGVFNTNRDQVHQSIAKLAATGAQVAGFGHGEAVLTDAADRIANCTDPFA